MTRIPIILTRDMAVREQRRPPRRRLTLVAALALVLALARPAAAHSFPYVPTQLLTPAACFNDSICRGRDVAYVFAQTGDGPGDVQLLAFNLSVDLDAAARPQAVSTELPFLKHAGPTTAFGAVRTGNGTIMVHAGACDGDDADVWSFDPGKRGGHGDGAGWVKRPMTEAKSTTGSQPPQDSAKGPFFLGGTIAFSPKLAPSMDQPTIYTYGGMCASPRTEPDDWQSASNYSKTMTSLAPDSQSPDTGYARGIASVAGPRAPFAGFTLTQLPPSMTNISGSLTQQASVVFLGGHTQKAYINMSTAAVWNLPEESWSYVNIQPPAAAPARDLALRQDAPPNVDSRSGHTAVLSEDGKSMVVLGGWVGDVNTAAEPQLAVLEMNQTYSSWRWTVPAQQPDGGGIYGHGAAMLPGNVMMVYGGWETHAPRLKAKRQDAGSPRFFNLTSLSWVSSYRNPRADSAEPDAPDAAGSAPTARRLGLGLGLGLGVAAVLAVIVLSCMWWRRQKRRRAVRDEAIRAMAEDAKHFLYDGGDMAERDDYFSWGRRDWRAAGPDPHHQFSGQSAPAFEGLRGGRGPQPAPGVITRKPVPRGQRVGYMAAESRLNAFVSPPGVIHPILEDDEEEGSLHHFRQEEQRHLHGQRHQGSTNEPLPTPASDLLSDPFATPTVTAPPVLFPPSLMSPAGRAASPEEAGPRHDPDVQDWVSDVDANDGLLARYGGHHRPGRISPTRRNSNRSVGVWDDESRTGSNLSESNRSVAADSIRRALSGRRPTTTGGFFATPALFAGGCGSNTEQQKPGSSSSSSYNTARSGFGALQAEAPSLLLGTGAGGRTTPGSPTGYDDDDEPGSPSKSKPSPRRGWLGSLRRVFSTSDSSSPGSSRTAGLGHGDEPSPRRSSFEPAGSDYESRLVGLSGELLRRKQGRQDWETGGGGDGRAGRVQHAENDWDIERAAEQRVVQVMFTVPRERLRVVNADDAADGQHQHDDEGGDGPVSTVQIHQPQVAELVDPDQSSHESSTSSLGPSPAPPRGRSAQGPGCGDADVEPLLLPPPSHLAPHHGADEPRLSHSTDGSARPTSGAFYTAEAVTMARARTRVLQMVDTIESLSRGSSPVRDREDDDDRRLSQARTPTTEPPGG